MISFSCPQCGKTFAVKDELAGRRGTCKACGSAIQVPGTLGGNKPQSVAAAPHSAQSAAPRSAPSRQPPSPPPVQRHAPPVRVATAIPIATQARPSATPPKPKLPMRIRRLLADAKQMSEAFQKFPLIQPIAAVGNPPELYRIQYNVRGLAHGPNGQPIYRNQHVVEIQLTSEYPRQSPRCKMLTPAFHPNIEPASICVGDHWTAGERLVDLVVRIGEMIAYQAYNIKSPLDGAAAMWADLNSHHFPIDNRDLHPPDRN